MSAAALLLLVGLIAAYLGRRSKPVAFSLGFLVLVFVLLAAMFLAADSFTGHGIDQAVLYHVAYGLSGAGFAEYLRLILSVAGLLAFGLAAAAACILFLTRTSPPRRALPSQRAAVPLAVLGCTLNPASKDLLELAGVGAALATWRQGDSAHHASFRAHYRTPKLGPNPTPRRNFVFIYGEGLERTYFDEALFPGLIVGLREIEELGTSFTNIGQTSGTSFTIGGMVGSQCGMPLVTSSSGNSMAGMSKFLPNAICLGDLLKARGYHLSYVGGAKLSFAGKGKFLSGHGFSDVRGRAELAGTLSDPRYMSSWGLHDDSLLDIAYAKFTELSSQDKPFGLFMLTLDTHPPDGHVSRTYADLRYEDGSVPMLDAVARSDRLLTAFIRRVLDSPQGKETLIVLASDHLGMQSGASPRLERGTRRNMFMLIDPARPGGARIDKPGTTMDIGPTVLHALGYEASLGLGRDLLSDEATLSQQFPDLEAALTDWRAPLSSFWGFSRLEDVGVNAADRTIDAGGTTITAPALITFDDDLAAEVFFATRDASLPDYLLGLPMGKPFVWAADCASASAYADVDPGSLPDDFCVLAGRRGAPPLVNRHVLGELEIDEDQLHQILGSTARPELDAEQTRTLRRAQVPQGLPELVESLSPGSVFFYSASDRTTRYIDEYAASPEVASRGIVWTKSLPDQDTFYFNAPAVREVRKAGRYKWRRLPLGDDLVTLLKRYARDTVILALRGNFSALSPATRKHLAGLGIDLTDVDARSSFAAVLTGNTLAAVAIEEAAPVVLSSDALRALEIDRVESAGRNVGDYSRIILNGKEVSHNVPGLNIAVLRRDGTQLVFNIYTYATERLPARIYKATRQPPAAGAP